MAPTLTISSFVPSQRSPLASASHIGDRRSASPLTPTRRTARLWDEYERRAVESARRRETSSTTVTQNTSSQRLSNGTVFEIIRSYDPGSTTSSPRPDLDVSPAHRKLSARPRTVAICKSCDEAIKSSTGVCEQCMKTIILPPSGESTPLLSTSCRNFGSTDLPKLHRQTASGSSTPTSSSFNQRAQRLSSTDFVTRLTSLPQDTTSGAPSTAIYPPRKSSRRTDSRNTSLNDLNDSLPRLHISRKPVPGSISVPSTRPSSPISPPCKSAKAVRPSSATSTPPSRPHNRHQRAYTRHPSITPSDLAVYPYLSPCSSSTAFGTSTPTSRCSVSRPSDVVPNMTSAWDDWDSEEGEKVRLVGYFKGKKGKKSARGSRESGRSEGGVIGRRYSEDEEWETVTQSKSTSTRTEKGAGKEKKTRKDGKDREGRERGNGKEKEKPKKRPTRFVRAMSCGC
ncbi:hypothetical protein M011DRAFT_477107 [Sporormia fimetaria CBS 119925]|uniref:Uncharacterized protein n=1 Tax=Sporormia fimetaria CBS 119925 TaxID=1340428 RepID=A0A6A6VCM2_9PLEO|nr:hypothetical protein M011DRAFT_477107 [Sporormia fimetaria CBS 119925]